MAAKNGIDGSGCRIIMIGKSLGFTYGYAGQESA